MMRNDKSNYLISLLCVALLCIMIFKTENYSKYFLKVMSLEFVPVVYQEDDAEKRLIYEFVPSYGADNMLMDNQYVYGESEYTYDNNEGITNDILQNNLANNNQNQDMTTAVSTTEAIETTETTIPVVSPSASSIVYEREKLLDYDFLISNCYNVASSTSLYPDEADAGKLLDMDMSIDTSGEDYKVLIYHTHGSEAFIDSRDGVTEDTIIGVGDELTRILNDEYGIKTYHDRTAYDMCSGTLDRSMAYTYSGQGIDKILEENPSIEVIIDLHRDGVDESIHLVRIIDGKPTAQIMFFNGVSRSNLNGDIDYLYNPNKIWNLGFSLQMHLKGKELYGDLMRKIYIAGYCYNLDRVPRASLVEVGAQTNTVEEAKNAMIPLARIIYEVLDGKH